MVDSAKRPHKMDYTQAAANYRRYYQYGGGLDIPVLRAGRQQYGAGFGSFFARLARGIFNFIRPAAAAAAGTAIRSAAQGISDGGSFKDIARRTLADSAGAALHGLADSTTSKIQGGSGRRRGAKRRRSTRKAAHRARAAIKHTRRKRRASKSLYKKRAKRARMAYPATHMNF